MRGVYIDSVFTPPLPEKGYKRSFYLVASIFKLLLACAAIALVVLYYVADLGEDSTARARSSKNLERHLSLVPGCTPGALIISVLSNIIGASSDITVYSKYFPSVGVDYRSSGLRWHEANTMISRLMFLLNLGGTLLGLVPVLVVTILGAYDEERELSLGGSGGVIPTDKLRLFVAVVGGSAVPFLSTLLYQVTANLWYSISFAAMLCLGHLRCLVSLLPLAAGIVMAIILASRSTTFGLDYASMSLLFRSHIDFMWLVFISNALITGAVGLCETCYSFGAVWRRSQLRCLYKLFMWFLVLWISFTCATSYFYTERMRKVYCYTELLTPLSEFLCSNKVLRGFLAITYAAMAILCVLQIISLVHMCTILFGKILYPVEWSGASKLKITEYDILSPQTKLSPNRDT